MKEKRKLKELTIKDNFMFGAVMSEEDNCRKLLELVLEMPIERVKVSKEKSIVYHPEYKGIRLDVYAEDEKHTHYNVEMQIVKKQNLEKRTRYYHSQIDMELLAGGEEYAKLPDTYVIFICDFDPFGQGKYRYTFQNVCMEDKKMELKDGSISVFLNTYGKNRADISEPLARFLDFVKADLKESMEDFGDAFIVQLQDAVSKVKGNREMEGRFMVLEEMLKDERAEGRQEECAENILLLLSELGNVSNELTEKIINEKDMSVLKQYLKCAAKAETVEQFMKEIQ
ncbi:MAG: Rpn family recombination-promoting nuclease/putative transposase [Lachnospiraceae bacterium]|nr:Rpn family recombination-promoting nuclease/putative transposase [Lachnospiraceae bacterium]